MSEFTDKIYGYASAPGNSLASGSFIPQNNAFNPLRDFYKGWLGNDLTKFQGGLADRNWGQTAGYGLLSASDMYAPGALARLGMRKFWTVAPKVIPPKLGPAGEIIKEARNLPERFRLSTPIFSIPAGTGVAKRILGNIRGENTASSTPTGAPVMPSPYAMTTTPTSAVNPAGNKVISSGHMSSAPAKPSVSDIYGSYKALDSTGKIATNQPYVVNKNNPYGSYQQLDKNGQPIKTASSISSPEKTPEQIIKEILNKVTQESLTGINSQYDALLKGIEQGDTVAKQDYATGVEEVRRGITGQTIDEGRYAANLNIGSDQPALGIFSDFLASKGAGQIQQLGNVLAGTLATNKQNKVQNELSRASATNSAKVDEFYRWLDSQTKIMSGGN